MARRKISTTMYITPLQDEQLRLLHGKTKVPVAEYIRQGIDHILEKHRALIPVPVRYRIDADDKGTFIQCLACQNISYSGRDVREHYCGRCDLFHDEEGGGGETVAVG